MRSFEIEGKQLKAFAQVMFKISTNLKNPITRGSEAFAGRVTASAKSIVHVKTGRLRADIDWWKQGDKVLVGVPTVFYGRFLEYGTRKMQPYPFLHPAVRMNLSALAMELGNEIRQFISEELLAGGVGY